MAAADALFQHGRSTGVDVASASVSLRRAIEELTRARLVVGCAPPTPPTLRGRVGALLVKAVRRSLFWLFPQLDHLHQALIRVAEEQYRLSAALAAGQSEALEAGRRAEAAAAALSSTAEQRFAAFQSALAQLREDLNAAREGFEHQASKIVIATIADELNQIEDRRARLESVTWLETIKCRTELERISAQVAALKRNQIPSDSASR